MASTSRITRSFPAMKDLCRLVLHTERFPWSTFINRNTDSMKLRNGSVYRSPSSARPSTRTRIRSPTPPARVPQRRRWQPKHCMPAISRIRQGRVSKQWPESMPYKRPVGLLNPGNLCYRRSLLQCLLHLPIFYNLLGNMHFKCNEKTDECVVCALQAFTQKYWHNRSVKSFPRYGRSGAVDDLDHAIAHECKETHPFHPFTKPQYSGNPKGPLPQGDPLELFGFIVQELEKKEHHR